MPTPWTSPFILSHSPKVKGKVSELSLGQSWDELATAEFMSY